MHLSNGTTLSNGRYRIVRFIGSGGFGCTYEAEHTLLKTRVAIKEFFYNQLCIRKNGTTQVCTTDTASPQDKELLHKLRRKFIDEATALFKLRHDGIVRVTDVFEDNGTAYYVMDYVEGKSLKQIVDNAGKLPENRALNYIRQMCVALEYIHSNNRLHLDIKPDNVMVNAKDNTILIDFGVSKQYDRQDGKNNTTLYGMTPGYSPLEQMSHKVSHFYPATDIYALGATLYKLVTGLTPPDANMLASGEDIMALPMTISPNTRKAIEAAMSLRRIDRPQTIREFLQILDSTPQNDATTVDRPTPSNVTELDNQTNNYPKPAIPLPNTQDIPNNTAKSASKPNIWYVICFAISLLMLLFYW